MKKIILDTNFLFLPFTYRIDVVLEIDRIMLEPYKIYVLKETFDELEKLAKEGKGKDKENAVLAQKYIDVKKIAVLDVSKQQSLYMYLNSKDLIVDDIILKIADKDTIVATQDKGLKGLLSAKGVKTIILRNKKHLEIK